MNNRLSMAIGTALFGLGIAVFLINGGVASTKPGTSSKYPLPTCEGEIGEWVTCNGRVNDIRSSTNGLRVSIRSNSGVEIPLYLEPHEINFEIGDNIRFIAHNVGGTLGDIQNVEFNQSINGICIGPARMTGRGEATVYNIPGHEGQMITLDVDMFREALKMPGSKVLYLRGNTVVRVENRSCIRGQVLSSEF